MLSEAFEISTSGRLVTDITDRVEAFCKEARDDGIVHVFLPHATAGLALMETGSGSAHRSRLRSSARDWYSARGSGSS